MARSRWATGTALQTRKWNPSLPTPSLDRPWGSPGFPRLWGAQREGETVAAGAASAGPASSPEKAAPATGEDRAGSRGAFRARARCGPTGVRFPVCGRGGSFRAALHKHPGSPGGAGQESCCEPHVGPRGPRAGSWGGSVSSRSRPHSHLRSAASGRREAPLFLLPAPAQPSRPYRCAVPASPQGSEGLVTRGTRAPRRRAPAHASLGRPVPKAAPSPAPPGPEHTRFCPGWVWAPPPSCSASPRRGLRPFRPLQRLLPGPETESRSLRFSLLSPRPLSGGEAERWAPVEAEFALRVCVVGG